MFTLLDVSVFFVHFIFLSVCSVFILFLMSSFILLLMYAFSIRLQIPLCSDQTNQFWFDIGLQHNPLFISDLLFCYIFICFYFWFIFLYFFLLSNLQYLSGVIVTVSSLKPAILYIVVAAAAIVFRCCFI